MNSDCLACTLKAYSAKCGYKLLDRGPLLLSTFCFILSKTKNKYLLCFNTSKNQVKYSKICKGLLCYAVDYKKFFIMIYITKWLPQAVNGACVI